MEGSSTNTNNNSNASQAKVLKCDVCTENDSHFSCSRCKSSNYCSKKCQVAAWPDHKKNCKKKEGYKAYIWNPPSLITPQVWDVQDMLNGPDQSMDPPEGYEHLDSFWKERNFIIAGVSHLKGCFVPPETKALIQEGLRQKRLTWDYMGSMNFFTTLTSALLPSFYMPTIIQMLIDQDIKQNAVALMEMHIEHWWRVNGLDPGSREYDPEVGAALRKHRITLPFTIEGHHNDEFRALTHLRKSKPGQCGCYSCLIAEKKPELDRLVWEAMRVGEAKRGRYIVSWEQYHELEAKRIENDRRAANGEPPLPPPSFIENMKRPIKVPKPEEIAYCMNMFKLASGEHRPIKTDELEDIVNALIVPLATFTKENLSRESTATATATTTTTASKPSAVNVSSAPIAPAAIGKPSATTATAKSARVTNTRKAAVDRDESADSGSEGGAVETTMAHMKIQETPVGILGRPKRQATLSVKSYNLDLHSEDDDERHDNDGGKKASGSKSDASRSTSEKNESIHEEGESLQSDDTSNYSLGSHNHQSDNNDDEDDDDEDDDDDEASEVSDGSDVHQSASAKSIRRKSTGSSDGKAKKPSSGKQKKVKSSRDSSAPKQTHDWSIHYAALVEYGKEFGHCNIKAVDSYKCTLHGMGIDESDYEYEGNLGKWLNNQRCMKRGTRGNTRSTPEREAQLQALVDQGKLAWVLPGISDILKAQGDIDWPRHYAALVEYGKEFGHCNIKAVDSYKCTLHGMGIDESDYEYEGNLGKWLNNQRCMKRGTRGNTRSTPEREAQLQALVDQGLLRW